MDIIAAHVDNTNTPIKISTDNRLPYFLLTYNYIIFNPQNSINLSNIAP